MSEGIPPEIKFNFIKSPAYRTTHIDGAFGGLTPKGNISVALFSERLPIPTSTVHAFDGKSVGDEIVPRRESREAIIRELEINCIMDVGTARIIAKWLLDKADELQKIRESA
jgi:hypothetical protein